MDATLASPMLVTKAHLSWFSSFRGKGRRREVETSEIQLVKNGHIQQLIVDGKLDEASAWIYDDSRSLLILKIHTISAPWQVRYYAFERVQKTKAGQKCWLCQHSCEDEGDTAKTIETYAMKYIEDDGLKPQTYHIELTEH